MNFQKLDLNLLVALEGLLTLQSVSRAAEKLNMSQSAMSNALSRLREYFDDDLLIQVGRKMELTKRAELLLEAVSDILLRVDANITALPRFDPTTSDREFRLSVSDYTMVTLIPHLLTLAQSRGPNVKFRFIPQIGSPESALDRGEVDILISPSVYCSPLHPFDILFSESFCCVVWNQSRFARNGKLDLADFASAGHVVMQPPGNTTSFESSFIKDASIERHSEVVTYSFVSASFLVIGTERISTIHARLAKKAEKILPVAAMPLPIPVPTMVQAMQCHKYRSRDSGLVWLKSLIIEAANRMDSQFSA
jgi:LysR family transcriptional regulator, nod-box dependent transcriptional activator